MAKDDEPIDDLHPVDWARMTEVPVEAPVARLDYGDAAQRVEMDGNGILPEDPMRPDDLLVADDLPAPEGSLGSEPIGLAGPGADEPVGLDDPREMVDAPIQIREPFTRAEKQRNQRRLPT